MGLEPRPFFATPRVVMGRGAIKEAGSVLKELGARDGKVLVVTDVTLAKLGLATRMQDIVTSSGLESLLFSDIAGEPTEDVGDAVINVARRARPNAVLGIGGGSALDMAKLAAVTVTNAGSIADFFAGKKFEVPPVPSVLIPTTAGTGAESSRNTVLSRGGRKAFLSSPYLVPAAAILDPELTLSLPAQVTAWTGMDALSHCTEAILSRNATPLTDAIAFRGIQIIRQYLPVVYRDGSNLEARAQMQVGAFLGGFALNASMVIGHSIAYTLANRLHLAHGLSCALALSHAIAYNAAHAAERISQIGRALGVDGQAPAIVREVRTLASSVGIAEAWRSLGLARGDLPALVDECITQYPRPNNPRPIERESLLRLYEAGWSGLDVLD